VAEPLRGEPAFDPALIDAIAERLPVLPVSTGSPLLDRSVTIGLAHIEATFQGDHPKYGVGTYAEDIHDGFPPTIIATVDALTLWGLAGRAETLFGYWLNRFVRTDGTIDYYGPSGSEYGQILTTARRLLDRGGDGTWLAAHHCQLERLSLHLRDLIEFGGGTRVFADIPEADEREQTATYFHNIAWVVRGLNDWAEVLEAYLGKSAEAHWCRTASRDLRRVLLDAISAAWPQDPDDWWLRPTVEENDGYLSRPEGFITQNRFGSYTNYRYWPELLSSGALLSEMMRRIVKARLNSGGQFCGMTRFEERLDDWPLAEYLEGLWHLGLYDDYRLTLWGHICYHQAEGHLTAYEQVTLPPGEKVADYCLPCQLVAARAAKRLIA
jgi:hypothetical protein